MKPGSLALIVILLTFSFVYVPFSYGSDVSPQSSAPLVVTEWPTTLRTNLKGTSLKVVLPENAPDGPWDDALIAKFQQLTGVNVEIIRPGNDTTAVLATYLQDFHSGSPRGDVYAIDIVWPGILGEYAEDLKPAFGDLHPMLPALVENDTVQGRLVAVPYFVEVSLLYYRSDLLDKYHFQHAPLTWAELEQQSRVIQDGERASGQKQFWGYLWQGAASEALTCNALEWQVSQGGGRLLRPDGSLDMDRTRTEAAMARAHRWLGVISPPVVTNQLEDDSLQAWKKGDAAFMRNWPYAYVESMSAGSRIKDRVGVTFLPMGEGPGARHSDTLGGFQLMVSNKSKNKPAAMELIKFLTSPEIQRVNASARGYAPTTPAIYDDPGILKANPFFGVLKQVLLAGAMARPSTAAGPAYDSLSQQYFRSVHQVLTGQQDPQTALSAIENQLRKTQSSAIPRLGQAVIGK